MAENRSGGSGNLIVLAAGGTGGHLFPAQALAEELISRGYDIHLMTDERVRSYGSEFPASQLYDIPSDTISFNPVYKLPRRAWRLWRGYGISRTILLQLKPLAAVGFGGYPSYPPMLAAARLRIPTIVHEQNAIMGRANRALASRITVIASSFPEIVNLAPGLKGKVVLTGNPVRSIVQKFAATPYEKPTVERPFRLLVFGGSQGARYFSELLPAAFADLTGAVRRKIKIIQQCRPEDIVAVRARYEALQVDCELEPFFADLPRRMASAHLVICRSGASTIAELQVIGRPAILVPLPHSIESDQLRNAQSFVRAGAGWLMEQHQITPEGLAAWLTRFRFQEGELADAAAAARQQGAPDAAKHLADLVESRITRRPEEVALDKEQQS